VYYKIPKFQLHLRKLHACRCITLYSAIKFIYCTGNGLQMINRHFGTDTTKKLKIWRKRGVLLKHTNTAFVAYYTSIIITRPPRAVRILKDPIPMFAVNRRHCTYLCEIILLEWKTARRGLDILVLGIFLNNSLKFSDISKKNFLDFR